MRRCIIILSALLMWSCVDRSQAQRLWKLQTKELPHYACVAYGKDTLEFPAGRDGFEHFYKALDLLLDEGRGRVSILHIGGSHVQAGYFSHRMRCNLSAMAEGVCGDRGCLFPFKTLRTNAPYGYSLTTTGEWWGARCVEASPILELGLTGAAVQTADTAATLTLSLDGADSLRWSFNRLRVWGSASSDRVFPVLCLPGCTLLPDETGTSGSYCFTLPVAVDSCTLRFSGLDAGHFTLRGLLPESDRNGVTYYSAGVNGAAVPSWLRCTHFTEELAVVRPDLVIFGIGINDANVPAARFNAEAFKENYRTLIRRIREVNPDCALLFITNNDCFLRVKGYRRTYNPNTKKVEQAFRELAAEYQGAVWNLFQVMGGYRASAAWQYAGLMRADRVHFTRTGYELLGDLLYNALINDYKQAHGER